MTGAARLLLRLWYYTDTTNMGIPQPISMRKAKIMEILSFCVLLHNSQVIASNF